MMGWVSVIICYWLEQLLPLIPSVNSTKLSNHIPLNTNVPNASCVTDSVPTGGTSSLTELEEALIWIQRSQMHDQGRLDGGAGSAIQGLKERW